MYIDDCIDGTIKLTESKINYPLNIGSSEMVSINQLIDIIETISDYKVQRSYNLDAPKGVRGRSSDNTQIIKELKWEPKIKLIDGMEKTYAWIYDQMIERY